MATPLCGSLASSSFTSGSTSTTNTQYNMGIGLLGDQGTLLKRKFRFLFALSYCKSSPKAVGPSFVKTASRPGMTVEDTPLKFLNETTWIPGRATWETIEITYYDGTNQGDSSSSDSSGLISWLATIYNFVTTSTGPTSALGTTCASQATKPVDWAGTASLVMLDGCGTPLEQWTLNNCFPTSVKFGELSYDSSDIAEISLTLRYSSVQYKNLCGKTINPCGCSGC